MPWSGPDVRHVDLLGNRALCPPLLREYGRVEARRARLAIVFLIKKM